MTRLIQDQKDQISSLQPKRPVRPYVDPDEFAKKCVEKVENGIDWDNKSADEIANEIGEMLGLI